MSFARQIRSAQPLSRVRPPAAAGPASTALSPGNQSVQRLLRSGPTNERIFRSVSLTPSDPSADQILEALRRLTGREVTASGDSLSLGAPIAGVRSSPTVSRFIARAFGSTRRYELRSGSTAPDGSPVRGSSWQRTGERVTITLNPADVGEFTWTAGELLTDAFVAAVSANNPSGERLAGTGGAGGTAGGMTIDEVLSTPLAPGPDPRQDTPLQRAALEFARQHVRGLSPHEIAEMDNAVRGGRGVTLAEILRGFETRTRFRLHQEIQEDRVTATYRTSVPDPCCRAVNVR